MAKLDRYVSEFNSVWKLFVWDSTRTAQFAAVGTALASDTRTHDQTQQTPAAALAINVVNRVASTLCKVVNKALADNLSQSQIIAAIGFVSGVASKPGQITRPFISSSATPPVSGSVLTSTSGTWLGGTTSFTYTWQRDGTNIGAATAATYTLTGSDIGGHRITSTVVAINAQGNTTSLPSNVITVP